MLTHIVQDLRYACRVILRNPMFATAGLACVMPAQRATGVDPIVSLRAE